MIAFIDLERMPNLILSQYLTEEFGGWGDSRILRTGIDSDRAQLLEIRNVLIDHRKRSVGRPLGDDRGLHLSVNDRKVEERRWIPGIWRPRSGGCDHGLGPKIRVMEIGAAADFFGARERVDLWVQIGRQAAGTQNVNAREDLGMFHADSNRAVSAHRVTRKTPTGM